MAEDRGRILGALLWLLKHAFGDNDLQSIPNSFVPETIAGEVQQTHLPHRSAAPTGYALAPDAEIPLDAALRRVGAAALACDDVELELDRRLTHVSRTVNGSSMEALLCRQSPLFSPTFGIIEKKEAKAVEIRTANPAYGLPRLVTCQRMFFYSLQLAGNGSSNCANVISALCRWRPATLETNTKQI